MDYTMQRLARRFAHGLGALTLTGLLITAPGLAQSTSDPNNPALSEGLSEESLYKLGELDAVNLFNGNLTLDLPLGEPYPVGGGLDLALRLVYNSGSGWEVESEKNASCLPTGSGDPLDFTVYHPSKLTNAGLGWTLSLGRLIPPDRAHATQLRFERWTYEQPDGHRRGFYDTLHEGTASTPGVLYSNDGSYLRLRLDATTCSNAPVTGGPCHVVEFPDGTFHELHEPGNGEVGLRPTRIEDRFGNWIEVDYWVPLSGGAFGWEITDRHGRRHEVVFEDGVTGRPRVDAVRLAAFADTTATIDFEYLDETVQGALQVERHQFDYAVGEVQCVNPPWYTLTAVPVETHFTVDALRRLVLPDQSFYSMEYHDEELGGDVARSQRSGALARLRAPTGVVSEWLYGSAYGLPTPGQQVSRGIFRPGERVLGVDEKRRLEGPAVTGVWRYDHSPSLYESEHDQLNPGNVPCYRQTEVRFWGDDTTVGGPPLRFDRFFFASADAFLRTFSGLGFTPCVPDDPSGTLYDGAGLSQQMLAADGTVLREVFVRYDVESATGHGSLHERNFRLREQRVDYHDDLDPSGEPHWTLQTWGYGADGEPDPADYDGLGHFRTVRQDSSFPDGRNEGSTVTRWGDRGSAGLTDLTYSPDPDDPWVLETYSEVLRVEGAAGSGHRARVLTCFDPDTGFLEGRRALRSETPGVGDLLTRFEHTDGNVDRERFYGGDFVDLGGDGRCQVTGSPTYDLQHETIYGVRSRSEHLQGGTPVLRSLDRTIDRNTGLVASSRDPAGVETVFRYDSRSRRIAEEPTARGWTRHIYLLPTEDDPNASVGYDRITCPPGDATCSGASALREERFRYDRRGQLVLEQRRMPGEGGAGSRLVERRRTFDALGQPTSLEAWRDPGLAGFEFATTYHDYDRFARPGYVEAPDGSRTTFTYLGDRETQRSVEVEGPGGPVLSTTTQIRDGKGRLIRVREPAGAGGGLVDTTYAYDEGDRLIKVCVHDTTASAFDVCDGQQRIFDYDDRGLLVQEEHPELGKADNTERFIRYTYDARGQVVSQSWSGLGLDRIHRYDAAGRLVQVQAPAEDGGDLVQEFFFLPDALQEPCAGRLYQAKQHQQVPVPGSQGVDRPLVVTETFLYDPDDGCSLRETRVRASQAEGFRALSFATTYGYDALGNIDTLDYPECTGSFCGTQPRQLTQRFDHGLLAEVVGVASLAYHPTLQLHTLAHSHGVTDTHERDATVWKPLHRITVSNLQGADDWVYGPFHFDDAQNLVRIETSGADEVFRYDPVGRLVQSTVQSSLGPRMQDLAYDSFGNLTSITTDSGTQTLSLDPGNRNRLGSGHDAQYSVSGAVQALTLGSSTTTYHRDRLDRVRRQVGGGVDHSFLYTALGERLASLDLVTGEESWTPRDSGNRALRRFLRRDDGRVDWVKDYVFADHRPVAAIVPDGNGGETPQHFHLDHLGSTRWITDAQRQVVEQSTLLPFGGPTGPPIDEELQFTGHERDALGADRDAHLDYMHARYYTSTLGRFLAVDPVLGDPEAPQTWNRYAYARNNPMSMVDPDGELADIVWDGLNVGLGAASLVDNLRQGNYGWAAVDAVGLVIDGTAAAVPVVPGGFATAIKATRYGDEVAAGGASLAGDAASSLGRRGSNAAGDAGGLADDAIVVRGGTKPVPEPGEVFSGAYGRSLEEAASGVPHGQIRSTTAGQIRAGGGSVEVAPELTRSGVLNEKHVNICLGDGGCPFGPLKPNPVPKNQRVQ